MRLIDADSLTVQLRSEMNADTGTDMQTLIAKGICERLCKWIDDQPTIEPEREKGKWTYIDEAMFGNPYGSYKCSVCDNRMPYKTNFCQRCGADMRGEQDG